MSELESSLRKYHAKLDELRARDLINIEEYKKQIAALQNKLDKNKNYQAKLIESLKNNKNSDDRLTLDLAEWESKRLSICVGNSLGNYYAVVIIIRYTSTGHVAGAAS